MIEFIEPEWPAPRNVRARVSTRKGGVSGGPWSSLNLGARCGDDPAHVAENRRRLHAALPAEPRWLDQVHGCTVVRHDGGIEPSVADACLADRPEHVCAILTADCLPVLLCNDDGDVVAAAHAGWRGLADGILERTVTAMGVAPGRLMAWLGPAISQPHFQVGMEVQERFMHGDTDVARFFEPDGERWRADLAGLARHRLNRSGVARVFGGDRCTFAEPQYFYSYRRDGTTGRFGSFIWISREG